MTKRDQLIPLESLPYFTLQAFKQVVGAGEDDSQRVRELLSRWTKEGHILRLKRGVYMTQKFYLLHHNETGFNPAVSAIILPQSYLSLHYVLQRHGILTEVTYAVTGVTQKNTRTIENQLGIYEYHHIKPELYNGFSHHVYHGVRYYIASKARALFDLFYFYPLPRKYRGAQTNLTEDLRLNIDDFSPDDKEMFAGYIRDSDSPKMEYVFENLRRTVWRL